MNLPPAPANYDRQNEQSTRQAVQKLATQTVRRDVAEAFLLITDAVTGETGKLTVESGVVTWTAL